MNICVLDGEKLLNRRMLHDALAEGLNLPDWYGRNLDALYDCLTDFQEETEIQILHKDALNGNLRKYAVLLVKVILAAAENNPRIHYKEDSL